MEAGTKYVDALSKLAAIASDLKDDPRKREIDCRIDECRALLEEHKGSCTSMLSNRIQYRLDRMEVLIADEGSSVDDLASGRFPRLSYAFVARTFSLLVRLRGQLLGYRPMHYEALPVTDLIIQALDTSRLAGTLRHLKSSMRR